MYKKSVIYFSTLFLKNIGRKCKNMSNENNIMIIENMVKCRRVVEKIK